MTLRKPPMRPLTAEEIIECMFCTDGCWFGCETTVDPTIDPMKCWIDEPMQGDPQ